MRKIFLLLLVIIFSQVVKSQSPEILIPYRVGERWGFSDTLGKIRIPAVFEIVYPFSYPSFPVKEIYALTKNGKNVFTVINSKGKPVLSGVYSGVRIVNRKKGVAFFVSKNGKHGVAGLKGEMIPMEYDDIHINETEGFIAYKGGDKWVFDADGRKDHQIKGSNALSEGGMGDMLIESPAEDADYEFQRTPGDTDWEKQMATKYGADRMKRIDRNVGLAVTALYKQDSQAVIFPYNKTLPPYFFPAMLSIKRMSMLDKADRARYEGEALMIVINQQGKLGLMTNRANFILPVEYDQINYYVGDFRLELVKNSRYGILFLNSDYPLIPAKYDLINECNSICVNKSCFRFFKVRKEGKTFYVGENGKEYYSSK